MNKSYWQKKIKTDLIPPQKSTNYDAIVIGGGIAGLSIAYWLQKKDPTLKIAILEKATLGFGASGRNAGFVTCGSTEHFIKLKKDFGLERAIKIWKFSEQNHLLLLQEIIQDQAAALDYKLTGSCTVAPSDEKWGEYKLAAAVMSDNGIKVDEVNPSELENDYGLTGFLGGICFAGDGYIDPIKLLMQIKSKLRVDIYENCEVLSVNTKNSLQEIKTTLGTFVANKIFITLNAYLPLVLKNFEKLITPARGQILLTEQLPLFVKGPCYFVKQLCYFRQLLSGELLVGGFRNLDIETENTYEESTTEIIQNALFQFIKDHFKMGTQAKIASQWSGVMGFSPDGQMLLGSLPYNTNIHIMAGCSGHGMGLSFHAAKVLVDGSYGGIIPSHLELQRFLKS